MRQLCKTAVSKRVTVLKKIVHCGLLCLGGPLLLFSASGCVMVPPILYPRTAAHGVVVDQNDQPVPNAPMKAYWHPHRLLYMFGPAYSDDFKAGPDGSWKFSVRKVDQYLFVEACPPAGYDESLGGELRMVKIWRWSCPTNNFVLRLRKIEGDGKLKEGH